MMQEHSEPAEITVRVSYAGRVQGVGFRYTVRSIAKHLPVTGYVKNLANGCVELVVQGKKSAVEELLRSVAEQFEGNIRSAQQSSIDAPEAFSGFEIRV